MFVDVVCISDGFVGFARFGIRFLYTYHFILRDMRFSDEFRVLFGTKEDFSGVSLHCMIREVYY